jgi:hypothetical protein
MRREYYGSIDIDYKRGGVAIANSGRRGYTVARASEDGSKDIVINNFRACPPYTNR